MALYTPKNFEPALSADVDGATAQYLIHTLAEETIAYQYEREILKVWGERDYNGVTIRVELLGRREVFSLFYDGFQVIQTENAREAADVLKYLI